MLVGGGFRELDSLEMTGIFVRMADFSYVTKSRPRWHGTRTYK